MLIQEGASEQKMAALAFMNNSTMADNGRELILSGITTIEEVMRVSKLKDSSDAGL